MKSFEIEEMVKQITDEVVQVLEKKYSSDLSRDYRFNYNAPHLEDLIELGASRVSTGLGVQNVQKNMASYIDHTLLKPEAGPKEIEKLCEEARKYLFASVCVNPSYVSYCAKLLQGSPVKVCTVVGFPLGATTTPVKSYETKVAEFEGATEIDMVIHVGALKSGGYDYVQKDIAEVVASISRGTIVKVIIETALLTDEEKIKACELAKNAGAHFVKTSTGFGPGGATASDVALMRKVVGNQMGVKASGGIRNREAAEMMIKAGATRIGASASIKIVEG